jgi:hypothetical protein
MKIMLHFRAEVSREYIFKPTICKENLHETVENGVTAVNFASLKNLGENYNVPIS